MVRYVRRPFGLVALFALLVSAVHSTSALRCLVDSAPAVAVATALGAEANPEHSTMVQTAEGDVEHSTMASAHAASGHASSPLHECPHSEAGVMSGCAVAPALPTGAALVATLPLDLHEPVAILDTLPHTLRGTDLFRPPRA